MQPYLNEKKNFSNDDNEKETIRKSNCIHTIEDEL